MKLGTSFRRLRTFAIVTALFLLSAVCMLTGSISAEGIWSTDDAIVLADAYPGSESSYEMPDESALDETLTIKKESGGDTYSVTDKGGNVIASALANMAAVRNEIEKKLVPSGGSFKLFFNCITMADQEYFQLPAVEGSIILSGDLTGNLSSWSASGGSSDRGVLVIDPQATQQNVYLYDFALTNTGSMQYAEANISGSLVPANPDKRLGRDRPNGLVVNSGTTGYANVFVLGGSSIRVTNEVFFSSYKEFRYDPKALGYASNTSLPGLGAAGFGREMSLAIPEVQEGILYPEEVESAKDYLLRLAYELHLRPGVTEEEAAIKLNYYKGRPLNEWVRSTRDFAANDFGDIYTYSTTSGGVTTYHIDTTQPPTGNAIRFLSAGSLVIDTDGEISNYGGDSGVNNAVNEAYATVSMAGTAFRNPVSDTRLYVKNGKIQNNYFEVTYKHTYERNSDEWKTTTPSSTAKPYFGHVFHFGYTDKAVVSKILLEGGNYACSGYVGLLQPTATNKYQPNDTIYNTPVVTVGTADGSGPTMDSGIDVQSRETIAHIGTQTYTPNTQVTLTTSGGFYFASGGVYLSGGKKHRADFTVLGGSLTTHRGPAVGFINNTLYNSAYDIHLAGGAFTNDPAYTPTGGMIANNSAGAASTSGTATLVAADNPGSTVYTYGAEDIKVSTKAGVTEERRVAGFTLTGKAANYASSGSTTTQAGLLHANSSYGSVPSFVINGGTFINTDTTANSNIFVVTGANKRDVQIKGGLFQSGAGQFLFMYNTDKDVVMTGGVFENTGNTTSVAVTIGNYSTAVYTQYSHDPSRYATFDSSGRLNETAVQGYGGKGILYLNGGEIRSNNNTTGLINVTKNNQTTAVVMGLEPRAIADTDGKGYIDGQKSDKVTKLVNKGSSAMIRIAPGINTTTSLSINGANRTVRIYTHSNSAVVIDRVDFEYSAVVNQDSVSYASIVAPQVLPEVPYPINFPTLRFTGTLAGGTYAEGGAAYSGLIGRIRTGVNVVELAPTFNDAGYAAPKPHILEIENLNQEIGLNGTLIRNVRGDGQSGGGGYRDHFSLYTQAAAALSGLDPAATAGYTHTEDILAEDWVNYNVLAVNWYTQKGIDGDGASVATAAAVGDFTAGNVPKAYDKNNGDEYRSRVYRADNGIKSNMTYNDVLGGFVGPTFEAGHVSAGMPKLSMPGYVHQGWTYTGMLSPYYSPTLAGLTEYGIYTTPVAEAVFVRADDPLKNHYDHFLEAQWSLDNPRVAASVSGAVNRAALAEGETIGYGYAVNGSLTLTAAGSHDSSAHIALTLSYSWEYMAADSDEFLPMEGVTTSALSGIKNVAQNGAYRVTVTATDNTYPRPMTSTCSFVYVVDILPKAMTAANIHMPAASQQNGERRYFSPKSEGFYFYDELGRLELTEGDDFRASPTISATYSAVGVYTFYFDFYGNYSGSNVQSDFIIYGDAAIYFSNLINGSTISTSSIPVDQLDVHPEDNSVKAYPQLPVPSEIEGYSFLHWTHNAIPVYSGDKYPANDPSVTLVAVWALRAPVLTTSVGGSPADTLVFEFDRTTHHILASAKIGTGQNDINGVTYAYTWYRFNTETGQSEGAAVSGLSTLPITYVQPLTAYRVTVTASASGLTSTASAIVHAEVKQKMMTAADILITPQPYDGQKKTPTIQIMHNGYYLAAGTDYTMQEPIGYENLVSAGDYVYTFTFINNYASADTTVEQTFKIYTDVTLSFGNLKPNAGTAATAGNITLAMNSSVYPALPDLNTPGIAGYDFLRWEYNGAEVEAGDPLRSFTNHTLMAVWQLKDPTVVISQPAGLPNDELEFVYDRAAHALTVSANVDGLTAGLSFTYAWTKTDSAGYTYTGATNYFTNVSDKGTYLVTVWVTDGNLTSAQVELPVIVTIDQKDIGASGGEFDVNVAIPVLQYADGAVVEPVISITHQNTRLQPDTDFKYDMEYFDTASGEWVPADAARYMGTYKLTIKGAGNYKGERDQTFVMTDSIQITFIDMLGTAPPALNEKDLNGSSGSWSYQVLAVPTNQPEGYTFLGWTYNGTIVNGGEVLAVQKSHVLTALWALNEIVIEDEATLTAGIDKPYTSGGYTLTVTPSIADKDDNANIIYTYVWYDAGGNPVTTLDTLSLNAVQDQAYSVTVTATGLSGLTRTKTVSGIRVRIAKLSINDSGVLVTVPSKNLLSSVSTATFDPIVTFGGVTLHEGVDYEITFWDADAQEFAAERPTVYGVGSYTFTFAGIGNFEDERTAAFTVTSLVAISFYTQIGTAPAAVTPENGRYPALGAPANFPQGYRFVGWQYNGATVQAGEALALDGSHMLVARFVLNEITLTNADAFAAGLGGVYIRDGYSITAQPAISGVDNLIFSYEWRSAGGALIVNTAELKRNGVSDSGVYTLTVKALDGHGIRPESDLVVTLSVVITPKDIGDDDVSIAIPQKTVNGSATTDLKPDNVVTSYNRGDMSVGTELALKILSGGSYVAYDADAAYPAGTYTFRFEGIGNFTGEKYVLFNVVRMDSPEISFYSMLPGVTLPGNIPIVAGVTYQNLQAPGDVPPGYAFLCWTRDGEDIADGAAVPDHSHTLVARYGLDESAFSVSAGADYSGSYDFSDGHTVTTTAALKGDLLTENHAMFRLSYVWQKDAVLKSGRLLYFGDVGDSGDWTVTVTVQDMLYGLTLTKTDTVTIEVVPIALSGFVVNPDGVVPGGAVTFASAYRTGQVRNPQFSVSYGANRLRENVDYTVVALGEVTVPGYLIAEGVYPFRIEAVDGGNYTDSLTVEFEIILKLTIYFSSEIPGVTSHNPLEPGSGTYSDADLLPLTAEGYTFEYWTLAGTKTRVNVGDPIVGAYNIYLTAVWTLNAPVKMSATADFRYEYDADTMREMTLAFTHSISDRLNAAYSWSFTPVGGTARTLSAASATYAIKNAAESGVYVLTVTLSDDAGRTAVLRQTFAVEITAKPLTADNVSISAVYYNGAVQPPVVEVADTASGGRTLRLTEGTDYVRLADGNEYRNARDYTVNIRFTGNYSQVGAAVGATYRILPWTVSFDNLGGLTALPVKTTEDGKYPALPRLTGLSGYTFDGWQYAGVTVGEGDGIKESRNHALTAVWKLNAPTVTAADIGGEYKWSPYLSTASVSVGTLVNGTDMQLYYKWIRLSDNAVVAEGTAANVLARANVADSGIYRLEVYATDLKGLTLAGSERSLVTKKDVRVRITPKRLTADDLVLPAQVYTGSGIKAPVTVTNDGNTLELSSDFMVYYQGADAVNADFTDIGAYELSFVGAGNFTGEFTAEFVIEKSDSIIASWWLWVVVAMGAAAVAATVMIIRAYLAAKRKKYGMKRHIRSFMDDFDRAM